jgi:Flp pilus assembly protein TadG
VNARFAIGDDRGQVAPLVAVMLVGLVVLAGLIIDAGLLFASRRDLQGIADGAARAGAMALDELALRSEETPAIELDSAQAQADVEEYLTSVGFAGRSKIEARADSVEVNLEVQKKTLVMGVVGIRDATVRASSSARPRFGIDAPEAWP